MHLINAADIVSPNGLRPKGSSLNEELAAEFTASIRTYALSRDYELPSLEELA